MQLFYQPDLVVHTNALLNEEESRHCAQVLRLKAGDQIQLTNGKGSLFTADLLDVTHKKCLIAVKEEAIYTKDKESSLHMAVAPTKNMDRMEWFLEKAVEMGIDKITPVICSRSERKEIKTGRLKKVAVSAMKQSLNYFLPEINEAVSLAEFIAKTTSSNAFICSGEAPEINNLHEVQTNKKHTIFLIGPEGDFTPKEIQSATEKGFRLLNLGASRLRTETAALHVVSIVNYKKTDPL